MWACGLDRTRLGPLAHELAGWVDVLGLRLGALLLQAGLGLFEILDRLLLHGRIARSASGWLVRDGQAGGEMDERQSGLQPPAGPY